MIDKKEEKKEEEGKGEAGGLQRESQIIDYQGQAARLLPHVAGVYAVRSVPGIESCLSPNLEFRQSGVIFTCS